MFTRLNLIEQCTLIGPSHQPRVHYIVSNRENYTANKYMKRKKNEIKNESRALCMLRLLYGKGDIMAETANKHRCLELVTTVSSWHE